LLPYIFFEQFIYILALEMASPGNQHCAKCIGTPLSFPMWIGIVLSTATTSPSGGRVVNALRLASRRLAEISPSGTARLVYVRSAGNSPRTKFIYEPTNTDFVLLRHRLAVFDLTESGFGWLGSRVVSVLDSGAEGTVFKSQS